jgi:hypothetical protein
LAAAKEFADAINGLGGLKSSSLKALAGEDTYSAFDAFEKKLKGSPILDGKNSGYLLSAFGEAGGAIGEVLGKTLSNERPTETKVGDVTVISSIGTGSTRTDVYTVDQHINVCKAGDDFDACNVKVDLTITIRWGAIPTGAMLDEGLSLATTRGMLITFTRANLNNAYLSAAVDAPVANGHIRFGENFSFVSDSTVLNGWKNSTLLQLGFTNMILDLPLTLQELNVSNPVSAKLNVAGTGAAMQADIFILGRDANDSAAVTTTSRTKVDVFELRNLEIIASGEVKDSTESIKLNGFTLNAHGDKVSVFDPFEDLEPVPAYVVELDTNRECAAGKCSNKTVINTEGESAADYLTIAAGVDLSASLAGVSPVTINAAVERSSDTIVSVDSADLIAQGASLELAADFNLEGDMTGVDAQNHAGIKLLITSNASGVRSGTLLTGSGAKAADVVEEDGRLVFRYIDGTVTTY